MNEDGRALFGKTMRLVQHKHGLADGWAAKVARRLQSFDQQQRRKILMFECVEHPDKLHAFEEILKPYGIKELVRTGRVAMRKSVPDRTRGARMRVLA